VIYTIDCSNARSIDPVPSLGLQKVNYQHRPACQHIFQLNALSNMTLRPYG